MIIVIFNMQTLFQLFRPLQESKSESQYFFTENTIEMLIKMFRSVGTTNIICIGAPTIHERILCDVPEMNSILLDIDHRYVCEIMFLLLYDLTVKN